MTCLGAKGSISKFCTIRSSRKHNEVSSWISINTISETRGLYRTTGNVSVMLLQRFAGRNAKRTAMLVAQDPGSKAESLAAWKFTYIYNYINLFVYLNICLKSRQLMSCKVEGWARPSVFVHPWAAAMPGRCQILSWWGEGELGSGDFNMLLETSSSKHKGHRALSQRHARKNGS